jgi:hypothetical protein
MDPTDLIYAFEKESLLKILEKGDCLSVGGDGFTFLKTWISCRPYDFQDGKLIVPLIKFCEGLSKASSNKIKLLLLKACKTTVNYNVNINLHPIDIREGETLAYTWKLFISRDKDDIARWLTCRTAVMYMKVSPSELTNIAWSGDGDGDELSSSTPVYLRLLQRRFDQLSLWFVSMVLLAKSRDEQILIVTEILKLGVALYNANNLHDLGTIYAALNNGYVSRLDYIFATLGKNEKRFFDKLDVLLSPISNYRSYRFHIAKVKSTVPAIPFTPVHLRDVITCVKGGGIPDPYLVGSIVRSYLKYQVAWYAKSPLEIEFRHWKVVVAYISEEDMGKISDRWKEVRIISLDELGVRGSELLPQVESPPVLLPPPKRRRKSFDDIWRLRGDCLAYEPLKVRSHSSHI